MRYTFRLNADLHTFINWACYECSPIGEENVFLVWILPPKKVTFCHDHPVLCEGTVRPDLHYELDSAYISCCVTVGM